MRDNTSKIRFREARKRLEKIKANQFYYVLRTKTKFKFVGFSSLVKRVYAQNNNVVCPSDGTTVKGAK